MLIYDKQGKLLACTDDSILQPLGYESVKDFFNLNENLSQLFIQRQGYVASYENVPWIAFVYNDILPVNKVLIDVNGKEEEFLIDAVELFSNETDSVGITFKPYTTDNAKPVANTSKDNEKELKDEELLSLLNSDYDEKAPQEELSKQQNQNVEEDLTDFELDFKDEQPQVESENEPQKEDNDLTDDLYNLDFDTDTSTSEEKPQQQEQKKQEEAIDLDEFELDFNDEAQKENEQDSKDQDLETDDEELLSLLNEGNEEKTQKDDFTQFIDSQEYSGEEVDLDGLSNELGLEKEECANFIYDFTSMVKAKEDSLNGENAAIEASSLKNIAENFRLKNIVKTLDSIANGESNAPLLFSQIEKLQKELTPFTKAVPATTAQKSSFDWSQAQKQAVEFDPNVAAESLGLPTELISEFVVDFIEQAQEGKDIFDVAYANQDIKTIQENAHKLKGAAANLRIEPLATKLEELQHNSDMQEVPQMLLDFWGMYLGLKEAV